jgi:RNA polymerase sigma factor (sigma-70 family)
VLGTDAIFEIIDALPVDQRQLVHDRIEGLTHREIAREQGVDERTVRQRWTKTKSTLKRRLRSRLRQDHDGRNAEPLLRV